MQMRIVAGATVAVVILLVLGMFLVTPFSLVILERKLIRFHPNLQLLSQPFCFCDRKTKMNWIKRPTTIYHYHWIMPATKVC